MAVPRGQLKWRSKWLKKKNKRLKSSRSWQSPKRSAYIEDRQEQEEAERPPEDDSAREIAKLTEDLREKHGLDDKKKASRHERRKKAHELLKREAEELRAKLGTQQPLSDEPNQAQPESTAAIDQGALENSLRLSHDAHGEKFRRSLQSLPPCSRRKRLAGSKRPLSD